MHKRHATSMLLALTGVLWVLALQQPAAYLSLKVGNTNHPGTYIVPIAQGSSLLVHAVGPGAATALNVSVSGSGVTAKITERLPASLGVTVTVGQNAGVGVRTVTVTYPMGSDTFRVRATQNPAFTHFADAYDQHFPSCNPQPLQVTRVLAGQRLAGGSHMKVAPHSCPPGTTMSIVSASATQLSVRVNVPQQNQPPMSVSYACAIRYYDENNPWTGHAVSQTFYKRLPSHCPTATGSPTAGAAIGGGGGTGGGFAGGGTGGGTGGGGTVAPPAAPNAISPANGATCEATSGSAAPPAQQTVAFRWAAVSGVAGSSPYEIQIRRGNAACADQPASSTPTCIWEPHNTIETARNLDANTSHAWRVRGVHRTNTAPWHSPTGKTVGAWSPWRQFTTRGPLEAVALTQPTPNQAITPTGNPAAITVSLSWQAPPCGASSYQWEVMRAGEAKPFKWGSSGSNSASVVLNRPASYTWRVRAATTIGMTPWSQTRSFSIK